MCKKLKKHFKSKYFKLRENCKWYKRYFQLKYPFMLNRIYQTTKIILTLCICAFIFFVFMYKTKIIVFENDNLMVDIHKSFNNVNMSGIITSQISVTMIVVSITSLIASNENKYILGKRAIELIFPKSFGNNFTLYLIILFLLAFLNIYFLMNEFGDSLMLTNFIFSILLVAYFVYKFASIFVNQNNIKKNLKYKYYKDNLKHIRKAKPLEQNISKSTEEFKNITIRYIRDRNVRLYSENIDIYFTLIDSTLYNNKNLVQTYYADNITHEDLISHIAEFAQELIEINKIKRKFEIIQQTLPKIKFFSIDKSF